VLGDDALRSMNLCFVSVTAVTDCHVISVPLQRFKNCTEVGPPQFDPTNYKSIAANWFDP
jgi:hypothetical protein